MSRTGNTPITIPEGIEIKINENDLLVKGKNLEKKFNISKVLDVSVKDKMIVIKPKSVTKKTKMIWGTTRSLINNTINGIVKDYEKKLELIGTGYKAAVQGKNLKISAGYSHDVDYPIPETINIKCPNPNTIEISGHDKREVGQIASDIRSIRKPEPYKGKGIKNENEIIHRKEGKKK